MLEQKSNPSNIDIGFLIPNQWPKILEVEPCPPSGLVEHDWKFFRNLVPYRIWETLLKNGKVNLGLIFIRVTAKLVILIQQNKKQKDGNHFHAVFLLGGRACNWVLGIRRYTINGIKQFHFHQLPRDANIIAEKTKCFMGGWKFWRITWCLIYSSTWWSSATSFLQPNYVESTTIVDIFVLKIELTIGEKGYLCVDCVWQKNVKLKLIRTWRECHIA